jgi:hypothetical protein
LGATVGKADAIPSRGRRETCGIPTTTNDDARHGAQADLEGRGGTGVADRQHALAEGGACGERLAACGSGREAPWGGEIVVVACLCFVEETNLVLLILAEGDTWMRLAW